MPPKTQFTREQIVDAAFEIAKSEGLESITTRRVAETLKSSIAPIYVNFKDLDELRQAVVQKTISLSNAILNEQMGKTSPFLDIGIASLRFAREYSVLFRDLVLRPNPYVEEHNPQLNAVVEAMAGDPELEGFTVEELQEILLKMRMFTVGLSVMVASGLLPGQFDEQAQIAIMNSAAQDVATGVRLRSTANPKSSEDNTL